MRIDQILILIVLALLIRFLRHQAIRRWAILVSSVVIIFWLQPSSPIRHLDFLLPLFSILITFSVWAVITPEKERKSRINVATFAVVTSVVVIIALTRYLSFTGIITPSRPPDLRFVLLPIGAAGLLAYVARGWLNRNIKAGNLIFLIFCLLVLIFIKQPWLSETLSVALRGITGQAAARSSPFDIRWFGISYIFFRMIHSIIDYKNKRINSITAQEFFIYIFFFPSIAAGPIDRIQRFMSDLRNREGQNNVDELGSAVWRILLGMFKKFAVADTLALIALNSINATQVSQSGWMWLLLYAYSFQILFDFSGYTDIAIGMGQLMGIKLPENFQIPYLQPNLKLFWDRWHITLTQWFRTYFFNPLSRKLRRDYKNLPAWAMVFVMQLSTMILIGLWHGITLNFVVWGLWHGLGLFIHNRFSGWIESRGPVTAAPRLASMQKAASIFITFHFVAIGWIWFTLPDLSGAARVIGVLFGFGA